MLPRTLEPEVMDTPEEATGYDAMDHSEVNARFVRDLLAFIGEVRPDLRHDPKTHVVDVGTGTALIPIELSQRVPDWFITGVDAAAEMLKVGRANVTREQLGDRIALLHLDARELTTATGPVDVVMSNSIVHHIPEPLDVLRAMTAALKPNGVLFVRDLLRPGSDAEVEHLVNTYADGETEHARQMFRQSLHAALTIAEVQTILRDLSLPTDAVTRTTDRHWTLAFHR